MDTDNTSLDMIVLRRIGRFPQITKPEKFHEAITRIYPCTYEQIVDSVRALTIGGFAEADFNQNHELVKIDDITTEGRRLLNRIASKVGSSSSKNSMKITTVNAQTLNLANEHIGDNNIKVVNNEISENVARLIPLMETMINDPNVSNEIKNRTELVLQDLGEISTGKTNIESFRETLKDFSVSLLASLSTPSVAATLQGIGTIIAN